MIERKIIPTADGSQTLYLPDMDEQYHSINGALTESIHVFINNGYLFQQKKGPVVFEVGFGTGLNCLLTALSAEELKRPTTFCSIEKYPLEKQLTEQLNYGSLISEKAQILFRKIHECEWGKTIPLSEYFSLRKIQGDLTKEDLFDMEKFDVVYFDAFGPDKQQEMWSPDIFGKIFGQCSEGAIFVTYSAKGEVRRRLATAGFIMKRLPGPPGKKEMLRGIK